MCLTRETGARQVHHSRCPGCRTVGAKPTSVFIRSRQPIEPLSKRCFELSPAIRAWLADHDFSVDGKTLVCRREFTLSKTSVRSRSYLNGQQINKPHLEDLRQFLVEITAQGQTVTGGLSRSTAPVVG